MPEQDKWADWLQSGRQRGLGDKQIKQLTRQLNKLRDTVIGNAKFRHGQRVLDVGAGTGLIALGARRKVKSTGFVVASDISHDALVACRNAAADDDGDLAALEATVGDVLALPFAAECFDVVTTRSVLIYIDDKPAAIRELFRVCKPGARVSIFEPINEVWATTTWAHRAGPAYDEFRAEMGKFREYYDNNPASTFTGWDERDLRGWFEEAGFRAVEMTYIHTSSRPTPPEQVTDEARGLLRMMWMQRPNPHALSFEEIARDTLGDSAEDFLGRFGEFLLANPEPQAQGQAYLWAVR